MSFPAYYTSKQSFSLFGHFFNNTNGIQDKFIAFWDHLSARLAHNDYIIGFDPMNEPAPANPAREPFLFMPGYFDDKYLSPFYNKIFETYYKNDPSKLMWFMPTQVPDYIGVY